MASMLLEHELCSSINRCFQKNTFDQENDKESSTCESDLTAEEKAELLYFAWNAFNSTPFDDVPFIRLGTFDVDKALLFDYLSQHRVTHVFFTFDVLAHLSLAELPSLARFLTAFLHHLICRTSLRPTDAACISDLLLLSWWSVGFASPNSYCYLSTKLYNNFAECIGDIRQNHLFQQISLYPDHANIFLVNLLRLYTDAFRDIKSGAEHYPFAETIPTSSEDPASRMLGVHASGFFQQLHKVYTSTLTTLGQQEINGVLVADKKELRASVVQVLKQAVRCSAMVDSLHQHTELPFDRTLQFPSLLIDRFSRVRDYLLVHACRCLANHLEASETNSSTDPAIPSQFTCLLRGAVPKHLISQLLSTSVSVPTALSASSLAWDLKTSEPTNASFGPHLELICRSLDRELDVMGYAMWFITISDPKDVHLANSVISRLIKHAELLAKDDQFCFALIVRLDRVRKAALPEQNYLKLLRSVLFHLPKSGKIRLLHLIQSRENHTHATPLSRNPSQLESRMRLLFNRLVVSEDLSEADKPAGFRPDSTLDQNISVTECNPEILLDCELLVLTCPLLFLTELVRLPVTRRCPASRLAVHQLLNHVSYCLPVPLGWNPQTTSTTSTTVKDDDSNLKENRQRLTIFQCLLLPELIAREPIVSLISDLDIEQFADSLWELPDEFTPPGALPGAFPADSGDIQSGPGTGLLITDPIVTSIVHLFELVPSEIAPLLECLTQHFISSHWSPQKWKSHTESLVHVLFSALSQWCSSQSTDALSFAPNYLMAILKEVLSVFDQLFVCSNHGLCSNRFDTGSLIASVIRQLLHRVCLVTPCMLESESPLLSHLIQIETSLCERASIGFQGLRIWLVWSEATESIQPYLPEPQIPASIPWGESAIERQVKRLLALEHICEQFRLFLPVTSTSEEPNSSERVLPRTLCFILMLAASSDSACKCVIKAAELINERNELAWYPDQLTLPTILLGVFLVLCTIAQSEQPYRWARAFYCFDRLVSTGILWVPYRWLGSEESVNATAICLTDLTALRGSFDQLSLFTDLLQLTTEHKVSDPTENSRLLRLLYNTLSMLVHRTLTTVSKFNEPGHGGRVSHLVRQQAQRCLTRLSKRLDTVDGLAKHTPHALTELRRLRSVVISGLGKTKNSGNT